MSAGSHRTRVLLVEQNRILLEGLLRLLAESSDMEVAGVAASGPAAVAMFEQVRPAITVIDLDLPNASAAEVVRQIRSRHGRAPILVLATYELDPAGAEAIASGAAAVIAKDQIGSMLSPLIRKLTPP